MGSESAAVLRELRELRRGRGLRSDDLPRRTGLHLRLFCGITEEDSPRRLREKLVGVLTEQCEQLPGDLRLAVLAAFALHDQADQKFLHERVEWVAARLERTTRTARRRVDEGLRMLAETFADPAATAAPATPAAPSSPTGAASGVAASAAPGPGTSSLFVSEGWYVSSMRSTLSLDTRPLALTEDRVITATADRLDRVVCALSVPYRPEVGSRQHPPVVTAAVPYGGRIIEEVRPSPRHTRVVIALPRGLTAGEQHRLGVTFTIEARAGLLPYYVVTPLRRYDQVSARVRFGAAPPTRLWRLDGVPPRVVEEFLPGDEPLAPDPAGEVRVRFRDLRPGLSYGLAWSRA
ncbi:hypothetical protein [Parafrankia sp. FMc2]|uniref:hypothetical protein n=1 Tax=Parafrankia sp. FMc2 TaxID=3233196 RepID=UPI0034D6CB60